MDRGFIWETARVWLALVGGQVAIVAWLFVRRPEERKCAWVLLGLPNLIAACVFLACTIGRASPLLQYNAGDAEAMRLFHLWGLAFSIMLLGSPFYLFSYLVIAFRMAWGGRPASVPAQVALVAGLVGLLGSIYLAFPSIPSV